MAADVETFLWNHQLLAHVQRCTKKSKCDFGEKKLLSFRIIFQVCLPHRKSTKTSTLQPKTHLVTLLFLFRWTTSYTIMLSLLLFKAKLWFKYFSHFGKHKFIYQEFVLFSQAGQLLKSPSVFSPHSISVLSVHWPFKQTLIFSAVTLLLKETFETLQTRHIYRVALRSLQNLFTPSRPKRFVHTM